MFEYADLYMSIKPRSIRSVILNVYGGEALHHPNIVEILSAVRERYQSYQDRWHLTVTTTTNAIVSPRILSQIIPLVDEFTLSYHVENTDKNKSLFKENLLAIQSASRRLKCVVLMHPESELFADCQQLIAWLDQHNIKHLPRQLDHEKEHVEFNYQQQQVIWFNKLYSSKGQHQNILPQSDVTDLSSIGRACCGGRQLCENQNHRQKRFFVSNKFKDWYCSVNHYFLYIKQVNGEIFVNRDCKMNFNGEVAPIGNLVDTESLLQQTRQWIDTDTMPVIQCKKNKCYCGLCAPKAQSQQEYREIMTKFFKK
jgi:hypothetical protein